MKTTTNCKALPSTTYCLASNKHGLDRCPGTAYQAARLGYGAASFAMALDCEGK